jgi:hypothetical protein
MPSALETALFARLIDHAPLFPPARLPLAEALEEHRRARESDQGWIVRRFVAPASALPALNGESLELSVVCDVDFDPSDLRVQSIEISSDGTLWVTKGETYCETDTNVVPHFAQAMAASGSRVKIRCGPKAPSVDSLAAAIRACNTHGLAFKATAGLHHAVRQDGQHGFLNLLAAAIFGDEAAALGEEDADAFRLDGDAFRWRDRAASVAEVGRGRELFVAFGSCSFSEPVDDLRALGFLTT